MDRLTARNLTRAKRQTQICKVFEIKIDRSHLSKQVQQSLNNLFIETKWFYNYCLSHNKINDANCMITNVPVKVKDEFENRDFAILQTQHRQAIKDRIFNSLKMLSTKKKQGHKVGKLKFKSQVNSIPLRELGGKGHTGTYRIDFEKQRITLAGIKFKWLKVKGLNQIPKESEIANAVLIKKGQDFYLNITAYQDKEIKIVPNASIGIDFGCESQLTFSNGIKINFQVPESDRLKRLSHKLSKNKNSENSKKKNQLKLKRQKEYLHLTDKRKDIKNKIVNAITKSYKYVSFQDESIHAWAMSGKGKSIQYSGIGGIISDLKNKSHTPLQVDKFFPSTQLCPQCGNKYKLSQSERTYNCPKCGYTNDRDVKSAICIETEGLKQIPLDGRDYKAQESPTSGFFDTLTAVNGIKVIKLDSVNVESRSNAVRHRPNYWKII